jgi:GNAT superfamily N-acetyltransferase
MTHSDELHFEKSNEADIPRLTAIMVQAFERDALQFRGTPMNQPPGYTTGEWLRELMRTTICYKIVKNNSIIGGFVVMEAVPKKGVNYLGSIFVDPTYQNQGVGSQCLRFIERKFPVKKWQTQTQDWATRNQHFYAKNGYQKVQEFYDKEEQHTVFVYEKEMG